MPEQDLQPLDNKHDRFSDTGAMPYAAIVRLNEAHRAFAGIHAVARVLRASAIEDGLGSGAQLSSYTEDGLLQAIVALSRLAENSLCELGDWNERQGGSQHD